MDGERRPALSESKAGSERDRKDPAESQIYTIRIKGHLDHGWSEWLDHLTISHEEDGTTVLAGPVIITGLSPCCQLTVSSPPRKPAKTVSFNSPRVQPATTAAHAPVPQARVSPTPRS